MLVLVVFNAHAIIKVRGIVWQFFTPHDLCPANIVLGRIRGIFNTDKKIGIDRGRKIRFKIHPGSAIIVHAAFMVLAGRIIFNHDRCFMFKPRRVSFFGI